MSETTEPATDPTASSTGEAATEATPEAPAPEPTRLSKKWLLLIAAGVVVVLAVAVAVIVAVVNSKSPFDAAIEECGLEASPYIRTGDGGDSLFVDSEGEDSEGASLVEMVCVIRALDMPESTITRMSSTRALDGIQSDEFNGIQVQWSYHPDEGLDLILTR